MVAPAAVTPARRMLLRGVVGAGLALARMSAWTQPAAARPVRIVVPAPAGGPADMLARAIAKQLGERLSTHVGVDNKPGGASIPAAVDVMRAAPDGSTLFLGLNTTHTQVPHLYAKLPYDPLRDFTPITQLYRSSSVLLAHPSVKASDLKELVAQAKSGEPIPFASASVGTSGHLYIEMLNQQRGTRFNHVPYKGSADASRDLLAGNVKLLFDSPTTAIPQVTAGRLKALAVTGSERLAALPAVPTAREQGFAELEIVNWMGVFGPAGMGGAVVERLNTELVAAVRSPEMRAQFEPLGAQITGTSAAQFADIVRAEHESWGRLIRSINLKLD
jgi:tripartite-type tricarboxylate transporter receptor subunit TctC